MVTRAKYMASVAARMEVERALKQDPGNPRLQEAYEQALSLCVRLFAQRYTLGD